MTKVSDKIKEIKTLARKLFEDEEEIPDYIMVTSEFYDEDNYWSACLIMEFDGDCEYHTLYDGSVSVSGKTLLKALNNLFNEIKKEIEYYEKANKLNITMIRENIRKSIPDGCLNIDYKTIVDKLQCLPNCTDLLPESTACWTFKDEKDRQVSIWSYLKLPISEIRHWVIGGDVSLIDDLFGINRIY